MLFPPGKLPAPVLDRLIKAYTILDERVVVGPSIGEDATALDVGDSYLLVKTDPITFVSEDIGLYVVNINANDIATMGGRPEWFLVTLLLPEKGTTEELVERIFSQIAQACRERGISFCGGHTEITFGLDRPLVIGMMVGEARKDRLVRTGGAEVGDDILLTKGIAIEGTSIIAREKEPDLKGSFPPGFIERCKGFTERPGISVLKDAEVALESGRVHSMHDPTEGGLSSGLVELATAAGVGVFIEEEAIPVLPECEALCERYGLDPLGVIASGALLITAPPSDSGRIIAALERSGIPCRRIGVVTGREEGLRLRRRDGRVEGLPLFERDELTKIL